MSGNLSKAEPFESTTAEKTPVPCTTPSKVSLHGTKLKNNSIQLPWPFADLDRNRDGNLTIPAFFD
jgi:hypothetical protein